MKLLSQIKKCIKIFNIDQVYPNEIIDLDNICGKFYVVYKVKMMPHTDKVLLTDFLNNDDIISGVSPIEVRALTQLECFYERGPVYNINAEKFNDSTKTYEILLKHKYIDDAVYSINVDDIVPSGVINNLSPEDAFRLGYSYALRRKK